MVSKANVMGLIAVFAGILIFQSTTYIGPVQQFIEKYPYIAIVLAFVLFFKRDWITNKIGLNGGRR